MREALLRSGYAQENIEFRYAAEVTPKGGERLTREVLCQDVLCHEDAFAVCSLSNVLSTGILRVLERDRRQTERLFRMSGTRGVTVNPANVDVLTPALLRGNASLSMMLDSSALLSFSLRCSVLHTGTARGLTRVK